MSKSIKKVKIIKGIKKMSSEPDTVNESDDDPQSNQSSDDSNDYDISFDDDNDITNDNNDITNDNNDITNDNNTTIEDKSLKEASLKDALLLSGRSELIPSMINIPVKKKRGRKKIIYSTDEDDLSQEDLEPTVTLRKTRKPVVKKTNVPKKGPGRPRKTPKKEPLPRKGIANEPAGPDNVIEMIYDSPAIFKKIIAFFKSLASSDIQIIFREKDIIFYSKDHLCKSDTRVKIDATKLNHYYCKETINIAVNCQEIEKILNKIDKEYSNIILISTRGNTQKSINLILENDNQIDEHHVIDLVELKNVMKNEEEFIDEDYMVKFTLPGRYFRKTINDIKAISSKLSIQQDDYKAPLTISYMSLNKKIRAHHVMKNASKIKLESQLVQGESFMVTIKAEYIKPISTAHIADEVWILVDEEKKFMTKAYIDDETIEIKTVTEIVDDRPSDEL